MPVLQAATAAAGVSGWLSWIAHLPASVTLLLALLTAACLLIILDFAQSWFDRWNGHLQRIAELEGQINRREERRRILDEIGALRVELVVFLNEMTGPEALNVSADAWEKSFHDLEARIGEKIRQFAGKASADLYMNRGTIPRHFGEHLPPHQLFIDLTVFDLAKLDQFITRNEAT